MSLLRLFKGGGKLAAGVITLPFRVMRSNLAQLRGVKQMHRENIVYIRKLARQAKARSDLPPSAPDLAAEPSFDEMMANRPSDAPSLAQLERRFLRQKRLALATCLPFIVIALVGFARHSLFGVATLLCCLPLCFMAALSAQLRLWQLRTRRLSRAEGGSLRDFMREIPGWYRHVLDPEWKKTPGEE